MKEKRPRRSADGGDASRFPGPKEWPPRTLGGWELVPAGADEEPTGSTDPPAGDADAGGRDDDSSGPAKRTAAEGIAGAEAGQGGGSDGQSGETPGPRRETRLLRPDGQIADVPPDDTPPRDTPPPSSGLTASGAGAPSGAAPERDELPWTTGAPGDPAPPEGGSARPSGGANRPPFPPVEPPSRPAMGDPDGVQAPRGGDRAPATEETADAQGGPSPTADGENAVPAADDDPDAGSATRDEVNAVAGLDDERNAASLSTAGADVAPGMTPEPAAPSADAFLGSLRGRVAALREALDHASGGEPARSSLRAELVALAKEIDAGLDALPGLKESLRPLAERYKEVFPRPQPGAMPPAGRIDHLGNSTYRERGWGSLVAGEYEAAIRHLLRAAELDPEEPATLVMLAWAQLRVEQVTAAARLLDLVLSRDPHHPLGRLVRAYHRIVTASPAEAIEILETLVQENADRTATLYAHLFLGLARSAEGNEKAAQKYLRRAIEIGPNLTEAYWELGRSHERDGRADLALEAWRAGGENRFNPWGERCRAEVKRREEEAAPGS